MTVPSNPDPVSVHWFSSIQSSEAIPKMPQEGTDLLAQKEEVKKVLGGWENLLKEVVGDESDLSEIKAPRRYIVLEGQDLKSTTSPTKGQKVLKLDQIIKISAECIRASRTLCLGEIHEEADAFAKPGNSMNPFEPSPAVIRNTNHVDKVIELTSYIVRSSSETPLRKTLLKLALATSFILIGLPFYLAMKKGDQERQEKIRTMLNEMKDAF